MKYYEATKLPDFKMRKVHSKEILSLCFAFLTQIEIYAGRVWNGNWHESSLFADLSQS